tara:strand:+ start:332 stop:646 length:315 start_codon:yes stop_codon:yes gene_type:complete
MDEDVKKTLRASLRDLNRAYSSVVAHSIISIHIYEEYLMNKATSRELAVAMSDLLKAMPKDYANHKRKKPRKATRIASKPVSKEKRPVAPIKGEDAQEEERDDF